MSSSHAGFDSDSDDEIEKPSAYDEALLKLENGEDVSIDELNDILLHDENYLEKKPASTLNLFKACLKYPGREKLITLIHDATPRLVDLCSVADKKKVFTLSAKNGYKDWAFIFLQRTPAISLDALDSICSSENKTDCFNFEISLLHRRIMLSSSAVALDKLKHEFESRVSKGWISKEFADFFNSAFHGSTINFILAMQKHFPHHAAKINLQLEHLRDLKNQDIRDVALAMLYYPHLSTQFMQTIGTLQRCEMYHNGTVKDNWSHFAEYLLASDQNPVLPVKIAHQEYKEKKSAASEYKKTRLAHLFSAGWKIVRFHGRTIIFQKDDEVLAVKVQKKDEPASELQKEFDITRELNEEQKKRDLRSQFPSPEDVVILTDLDDDLSESGLKEAEIKPFKAMIEEGEPVAYFYKPRRPFGLKYFDFLYDTSISDAEFAKINDDVANDLYRLLFERSQVFHQLADLFHTRNARAGRRDDKGRYYSLSNLLHGGLGNGNGSINDWLGAVRYVNLRATGLADVGDSISVAELLYKDKPDGILKQFFKEALLKFDKAVANPLLLNFMSEYQLVLLLVAGTRGKKQTDIAIEHKKSDEDIFQIWLKLANLMVENCVTALHIGYKVPKDILRRYLSHKHNVDVKYLAKQMKFWMTDECIPWLKRNELPADLYPKNANVKIDLKKAVENKIVDGVGCSADGIRPDLGLVNAPFPIKEFEKLIYAMTFAMESLRNYNQEYKTNMTNAMHAFAANDFKTAETSCKQARSSIAPMSLFYHRMALRIDKACSPKVTKETQVLSPEAKQHYAEIAALRLQRKLRHKRSG